MNINERINRILFIMSYVSQNQGIPLEDLAKHVDMRPKQLIKEMDFMLLIGKPPFKPDDYVDIYVEDNKVYIEYDQMLNRPLRFTRPEIMALLTSIQLLDPEVEPKTVESLRKKIKQAISSSLGPAGNLEDRIILEKPSRPVSQYFTLLRQAIEQKKKVKIEYYSLMSNTTNDRIIRPYFLMKYVGYWYLTGYCQMRKDLRTFKFERILSTKLLKTTFPSPKDLDVDKYKDGFLKSMGRQEIKIYFDSTVAPWIKEQWGSSVKKAKKKGVILTLFSETLEYPSRLILSFASHAHPLSPPELVEKVHQDSQEIAAMYKKKAVSRK